MALPEVPKLNMSVGFAATSAIPMEPNSYFKTYAEAAAAAATAEAPGSTNTVYYFTQVIHVTEGDDAGIYVIRSDGTLEKFGGESSGGDGDKSFIFTQATASSQWEIDHNLDKYPSVSIVDSGGNEVVGDVTYLTKNKLSVAFTAPFSGKAYLN